MAKARKGGKSGARSGGGMLSGMRSGFRGMVHGEASKKKESTFWNVFFYLAAGLLALLLISRWIG